MTIVRQLILSLAPPLALAPLLALALSGCVSILESGEPAERIYWLEPISIEGTREVSVALRISVVPGLDSDRVGILEDDQRLNHYAGARWSGNLSRVLQSVIERSLNPAGSPAVSETDVTLDVLIERFFAVEVGADRLPRIELQARIQRIDTLSPICSVNASAEPATERLRDIVKAHQQVLDELTRALGEFVSIARHDESISC